MFVNNLCCLVFMQQNATRPPHLAAEERLESWLAPQLGERIALRRRERGWTQADLAEKLGVETETVSRFERGHALPSLKRLVFLAEVLDASIHDLMGASSGLTGDVGAELQELLQSIQPAQRRALLNAMRLIAAEMS